MFAEKVRNAAMQIIQELKERPVGVQVPALLLAAAGISMSPGQAEAHVTEENFVEAARYAYQIMRMGAQKVAAKKE